VNPSEITRFGLFLIGARREAGGTGHGRHRPDRPGLGLDGLATAWVPPRQPLESVLVLGGARPRETSSRGLALVVRHDATP
jgi:hypothetical protein